MRFACATSCRATFSACPRMRRIGLATPATATVASPELREHAVRQRSRPTGPCLVKAPAGRCPWTVAPDAWRDGGVWARRDRRPAASRSGRHRDIPMHRHARDDSPSCPKRRGIVRDSGGHHPACDRAQARPHPGLQLHRRCYAALLAHRRAAAVHREERPRQRPHQASQRFHHPRREDRRALLARGRRPDAAAGGLGQSCCMRGPVAVQEDRSSGNTVD